MKRPMTTQPLQRCALQRSTQQLPWLLGLVLAWGCAQSSSDKEGSQTHFTEMSEGGAGSTSSDDSTSDDRPRDAAADDDEQDDDEQDDDAIATNDDQPSTADDTTSNADDPASDDAPTSDDDSNTDDSNTDDSNTDDSDQDDQSSADDPSDDSTDDSPTDDDQSDDSATDDSTEYDACEEKSCGDPCDSCAPDDDDCIQPDAEHFCNASGECKPEPASCSLQTSLCAATEFESTDDGCVEESWLWDGGACTPVTHCGCASGSCDRLYADEASCDAAHDACLPGICQVQDAQSAGPMCGTLEGFAFSGYSCIAVYCVCGGEDCDDIEPTEEACLSRFAECLDRTPSCVPDLFPIDETDPAYEPTYPPFSFSVEGYDELFDEESQSVTVFADWTAATWEGWESAEAPETCLPIPGAGRFTFECPSARPLLLGVGDETIRVLVTLHWGEVLEVVAPEDVEVRIVAHPSGSFVFQVRDAATQEPVLMVVRSRLDSANGDASWDFGPFTFAAGEPLCTTPPDMCNWSFSARHLEVSTADEQWTLTPHGRARADVGEASYGIYHGYIFDRTLTADVACAAVHSTRQNFALARIPPLESTETTDP